MCGIVGICNFSLASENLIKKMNLMQSHRGPDSNGYFIDKKNKVYFGMTRLAIIGLQTGNQPQYSEDKKIVLVFNGEIYNYKELGKFYFNADYNSDSQLLVDLYKKLGINFLSKLNGMFSIAIFDKEKNKVFLIRDRFGIKPLYFAYINNCLYFSSELRTILKSVNLKFDINDQVVWDYFSLGYCTSDCSIYKGINKLSSGSYLEFDILKNRLKIYNWWKLSTKNIFFKKKEEYYELIYDKLVKAIKSWAVSDVPICFMVSGGLDSSLLGSIYSKIHKKKINTASFGFKEDRFKKWNELDSVKQLIKTINSNHLNIYMNNNNFLDDFNKIIDHLSEPFGGGLPSWYFFKNISKKKKYKVVVSGTGGDELFGNYNRQINYINKTQNVSQFIFDRVYSSQNFCCDEDWKKKYLNIKFSQLNKTSNIFFKHLKENKKTMNLSKSLSYLDFQTQLQDDFLYLTDRFSMAHSLEVRTPFLDHNLVETVFNIPEEHRIEADNYKPILKYYAKKFLPKIYHNSPKKGFSLPLSIFMRTNLKKDVERVLSIKRLKSTGIVDYKFYEDYVKPMLKGNNNNIQLVWNVFMFYNWLENQKI
jgi:asparagine synthase (glutamine-hydrolysing)